VKGQRLIKRFFPLESASQIQAVLPQGVYGSLAQLYFEDGNWEKAVSACQSELKNTPATKEILKILAVSHEKLNQKEQALKVWNQLQAKDPQNAFLNRKIKQLKSQLKKTANSKR